MTNLRHDWQLQEVNDLYELPFIELLYRAQTVHRLHFDPNVIQLSTLLSIKTGTCPEDCAYCPQSGHYNTGLQKEKLISVDKVIANAKAAKSKGATRFCLGAAWRSPSKKDFPEVIKMVKSVKSLGLETCLTAGMLSQEQADALKEAGLDYYNHNLDSSPEFYKKIITTRSYQDRIDTLKNVRDADLKVCCGGIIGMGESRQDRMGLLIQLANLPQHPESVPINQLIPIPGTPLENVAQIDDIEFVKTIAVARIMMPRSVVRLSAGREGMNDMTQLLCFFAGANSIFIGEQLLTSPNPTLNHDMLLFERLGITTDQTVPV